MPNTEKLLDELVHKQDPDREFHQENTILKPLLTEISHIANQNVQYFVRSMLLRANEFWFAPADNRPGAHPKDEYSTGGLVLHTQRVVRAALILCDAHGIAPEEKDLILAACILHDLTKAIYLTNEDTDELFWDPMHPYTVEAFLKAVRNDDKLFSDESQSTVVYIQDEVVAQIMRLIRCHLGLYSPVPETIPMTTADQIVHLADYIACNLEFITDGAG